jgi:hypothetical protein
MKYLLILLFLADKNTSMAQKIMFVEDGLNVVKIGDIIDNDKTIKFTSINDYPDKSRIIVNSSDGFKYYFANTDSMFIEKVGLIRELILAEDSSDKVTGIFLYLENPTKELVSAIGCGFGKPALSSNTTIEGHFFSSKLFWRKNDICLFSAKSGDSDDYIIKMYKLISTDDKHPYVSFR